MYAAQLLRFLETLSQENLQCNLEVQMIGEDNKAESAGICFAALVTDEKSPVRILVKKYEQ